MPRLPLSGKEGGGPSRIVAVKMSDADRAVIAAAAARHKLTVSEFARRAMLAAASVPPKPKRKGTMT